MRAAGSPSWWSWEWWWWMLTSRRGSLIGMVCQLHRNHELLWNILPFESPLIVFCCWGNHICWEQINWNFVGREIQLCWVFYEYSHAALSKVWNPEVESESGKIQRNANKPTNHKGRYKQKSKYSSSIIGILCKTRIWVRFIIWQTAGCILTPGTSKKLCWPQTMQTALGCCSKGNFQQIKGDIKSHSLSAEFT